VGHRPCCINSGGPSLLLAVNCRRALVALGPHFQAVPFQRTDGIGQVTAVPGRRELWAVGGSWIARYFLRGR